MPAKRPAHKIKPLKRRGSSLHLLLAQNIGERIIDGTYAPLSRPIFIYVNAKAMTKPEVKKFVETYMQIGAQMAKEVKYVPLPAAAYKTNLEHLAKGKKGTVFGGKNEVGITIEALLKREAAL